MFLTLGITVIGILLSFLFIVRKTRRTPPGPWGFPILGHLPLMGDNPAKALLKWKSIYGPIISVKFGSLNTVVFNDIKTVKEAFSMYSLNARKDMSYFPEATNRRGILFGEGQAIYEQRRFVMKAMKDFGLRGGNADTEVLIHHEISDLLDSFRMKSKEPMSVHQAFNLSTVNVVWLTLMGKRFEHGDTKLTSLAEICSRILKVPTGLQGLSYFLPWLAKLMPELSGYNKGLSDFRELTKFMEQQITELRASWVKEQPRNFTDAYLDKVESTTDENSSFFPSKNVLPFTLGDLFLGAIDTTSTLLEWTLIYLAINPDVQRKLQKEILDVTGDTRLPSLADRPSMPYTEAVIHEVIRIAPLLTFNGAKEAIEDTPFQGYNIPKGAMLFANYYALFKDPEVWGDPENFRPERFIDESGKFVKPESMIQFGWGKRVCVGENLARDQSFLYVTSLFQKFNVNQVPGEQMNLQGIFAIVVHPDESNQVILTERN